MKFRLNFLRQSLFLLSCRQALMHGKMGEQKYVNNKNFLKKIQKRNVKIMIKNAGLKDFHTEFVYEEK